MLNRSWKIVIHICRENGVTLEWRQASLIVLVFASWKWALIQLLQCFPFRTFWGVSYPWIRASTITSFKSALPNCFSVTLRKTCVTWKPLILRLMKSLKSECCSSVTTSTTLHYMAWFRTKSVSARFSCCGFSLYCTSSSFTVSILLEEFQDNDIFLCGYFWGFKEKPLLIWNNLFFTAALMT